MQPFSHRGEIINFKPYNNYTRDLEATFIGESMHLFRDNRDNHESTL